MCVSSNQVGQSSNSSIPAFGASSSPAFGSSMPAFGASSSPAFGASSSAFGGSSAFGSTTPSQSAFGVNLFGSTPFVPSSQPAPGATSAPTLGARSAPAFGSTSTPAFGISPFGASSMPYSSWSSPAFGQSTSAFGSSPFGTATSPFGAQSFPFGAQTTTPVFRSPGFGQTYFGGQRSGSRVTPYSQTPEADSGSGTQPAGKLESVSAMYSYFEKSHEELRWEDYQLGDKGGQNPSNLFTPKTSTFTYTPGFGTTGSAFGNSLFGASSTPAFGQSTSAFSSATSPFGAQSSPFGGQATTPPAFGSCGFGQTSFGGQRGGSRVTPYAQTSEGGSDVGAKLNSISAMSAYKEKSHEKLRWEDYQSRDKGGPNPNGQTSGGMGFNTNTTQSNPFSSSPAFTQLNSNPFSSTTSTSGQRGTPFGATSSCFCSGQSPAFGQSTSAFDTATSPFGAQSSPFGVPNPAFTTLGFTTSAPSLNSSPFGATSSNPFGSTPGFGSSTSAPLFGTPRTPSNSLARKKSTFGQWSTPFGPTSSSFGSGPSPAFVHSTSAFDTATSPFEAQSSPFGHPNPVAHSHTSNGIGFSNSSPFGASSSNSIPFGSTPGFGSTNSVPPFGTQTKPTSILGTTHKQGAIPSFASAYYWATPSIHHQPTQNSVEFGFLTPAGGLLRITGQKDDIVQMLASQTPSVRDGIFKGGSGRNEYYQQGDKGANPSFATSSSMGFNHTTSAQPTQNAGGFGFTTQIGGIGGTLSIFGGNNLVFSFSCLSFKEQ